MNFVAYSKYYNLLYQDKDTEAECAYIIERLKHFGFRGTEILELGAGSGRHGAEFAKLGYQWRGIERSSQMVKLARGKGLSVEEADIVDFTLEEDFPIVLSLFHVVSYLTTNAQITKVFQNAHRHLKRGGVFLFDIWYSPAVYHQTPEKRKKVVESDELKITRQAIPEMLWNENVVNVKFDVEVFDKQTKKTEEFEEIHPMRHFSLPEIKYFAESTMFEFVLAEEWLTGNEPGPETWGVTIILKKNG